jgi:Flp pilus assembly secretin CpaC
LLVVLALSATMAVAGGFQDLRPGSDQALVLEVGRSLILRFEGMTRVAITHHEIADVSVASSNELIIVADPLGKGKTGNTMLYVWDRRGLHKFAVTVVGMNLAEKIALNLQAMLGSRLSARAMSCTVVVIEGQVADKVALDNLEQLADASSTDDVQVVAMASAADGGDVSPAARAANALTSILDPSLKITAWGKDVVVVEGELPTAEQVMQARGALSAFADDLKIVDMITVKGETLASQAPVAQIQKMLGPDFRVTQLRGKLVAVDGTVASAGELARVESLLAAFEDDGVQTINMVLVIPPMPDLSVAQGALQAALGDEITVKRVGDEALMIEGSVPNEARRAQLDSVLALLGGNAPILNLVNIVEPDRRRVLVGVKIVEVSRDAADNLGIDWGQYEKDAPYADAQFRQQPFLYGQIPGGGDGMNRLYYFGAQLHALVQTNKARILSEPNLLVNDGEEATILIGGEIPIPVMDNNSVSIVYKEYGVNLKIKPTITPDGTKIILGVEPEVSSLDYSNGVVISGFTIPGVRTRRAVTQVTMDDGSLLAIGGLIQNDQSTVISKIPLLGDLPIIGQFFRHSNVQNNRSELIILVVPQILGEDGQPTHPIPVPEGYPENFFNGGERGTGNGEQ